MRQQASMGLGLRRSTLLVGLLLFLGACTGEPKTPEDGGTPEASGGDRSPGDPVAPLAIGAIPDQDPDKVQRLSDLLVSYLGTELEVPVVYQPVTDYAAAVSAFKVGDLDLVWFGGLTGVQARLQVPGAQAIAQRDIDEQFKSVFIANSRSGIEPFTEPSGLMALKDHSFTFGSESSTSGRLMPQYFLQQAGLTLADFQGEVGFSGNHDATLKLVEAGTYEVGALNSQVWESRLAEGAVDTTKVEVVWWTPPYYDYHWVISPAVAERYGPGFNQRVEDALIGLDATVPEEQEILDLFGATRFIPTRNENYDQIEAVGRDIGKIE
nr:putative selenate ABC transporter substrate-binding protein [Prochlorothrix hollandica]